MALRPLTENDLDAVASWCEEVSGLRSRWQETQSDSDGGLRGITVRGQDRAIGVMEYRVGVPDGRWMGFRFVAVEPRLRGLGLDSEAVRLVEDYALERRLACRFWAGVRHDNGLGVYFWLRLGYRQARADEDLWGRHRPNDIITMIRMPRGQ